jgi:hypothetical protein
MILVKLLCVLAAACCLWAVVASIRIVEYLDRRGIRTPWPLLRLYFFRNMSRYREITVRETGRPGRLYYSFLIPINAAWMLALAALALRRFLP